jgi:hypothetical protein
VPVKGERTERPQGPVGEERARTTQDAGVRAATAAR